MIHLQRDMEDLKKQILAMGAMVEDAIQKATVALHDRRPELAREIIDGDAKIDRREVEIEELALKILALHQPVATDLRFIAVVMKVNNDLERMADYAVNVAERALSLSGQPPIPVPDRLEEMTEAVMGMVEDSLDCFVNGDADLAWEVQARDDVVDEHNVEIIREVREMMTSDPDTIESALHVFSASRYLERVADLATNIAEDVIYMVEGDIVRHHHEFAGQGGGEEA